MVPRKEDARRRQSWTKRLDDAGLPGKVGYFTGSQWAELEKGARAAGFLMLKTAKGGQVEVPDVIRYVMHLHHNTQGAASN